MSTILSNTGAAPPGFPPYSDTTIPRIIPPLTIMFFFALVVYATRIVVRARSYGKFGPDDVMITIAMLLTLCNYSLIIKTELVSGGKHTYYETPPQLKKTLYYSFFSLPIWVWSVSCTKISVLLMLLRIKQTPMWKRGIAVFITFVVLNGIAITLVQLLQCRPIKANWDISLPRSDCLAQDNVLTSTYIVSSFFILTDVMCACLPLIFISKINRPLREKVVLAVLMALGLLAAGCGIAKLVLIKPATLSADPNWRSVPLAIWSYAEEDICIIAACIPCLKALMEKAFRALGGQITSAVTRGSNHGTVGVLSNRDGSSTLRDTNGTLRGSTYQPKCIENNYGVGVPRASVVAFGRTTDVENGKVIKEVEISWSEDQASERS